MGKVRSHLWYPLTFVILILTAYAAEAVCRVAYLLENWQVVGGALDGDGALWMIVRGSLLFDTSAVMYTNALVALLLLLPYPFRWKHHAVLWSFVILNGLCVCLNLADAVYFRFTGRRTTMTVLQEFQNEDNLGSIFGIEILRHWYLVVLGIAVFYALYFVCKKLLYTHLHQPKGIKGAMTGIVTLLLFVPLCIAGIRGGFTTAVRPITLSNANQYVSQPQHAALILNTPFSLIRSYGKAVFHDPQYMDDKTMVETYSPEHITPDTATVTPRHRNIVILIVESFGREYIGALNTELDGGQYKGYTPEVDRIIAQSLTFDRTYCNGRKSIDGMPSILSSIPMFVEPFFLTPAAMNDVSGIAGELKHIGYESAFFHGAENGSMGFQAFARSTGFDHYYGRTEYNADKRFDGDEDFDGTWAIWDEPFLQYYALKMTEMHEPFVTAVFTASSHHPFNIPDKYKDVYKDDGPNTLHKCIQYTDHAIGEFFRTASRQPWFKNTVFVITSDHTNGVDHPEYATSIGGFCSPIIIYDPSGDIKPGRRHAVAQQIDIMPTMLSYVGYTRPYVAFGKNLFDTPDGDTWAVNYDNGIYQLVRGDLLIQFNGTDIIAMYNLATDPLLRHDIKNTPSALPDQNRMEQFLKAIIQQYMQRMTTNRLK